jgi:hypothetical protein
MLPKESLEFKVFTGFNSLRCLLSLAEVDDWVDAPECVDREDLLDRLDRVDLLMCV